MTDIQSTSAGASGQTSRERGARSAEAANPFGAYYAAKSFHTAVAETTYHRALIYADTEERPGWFSEFRELEGAVNASFRDIRDDNKFADCLDPDSDAASKSLAQTLRADGANGVVYRSLRDEGGECVAAKIMA